MSTASWQTVGRPTHSRTTPVNGYDAPMKKTTICYHWKHGRCSRNAACCDFAHGERDRHRVPPKPCYSMQQHGRCYKGDACPYADSHALLRPRTTPPAQAPPEPAGAVPAFNVAMQAALWDSFSGLSGTKPIAAAPTVKESGASVPTTVEFVATESQDPAPEQQARSECCICMVELNDTKKPCALVPCGHAMTCAECAEACTDCPVCRSSILMRMVVHL